MVVQRLLSSPPPIWLRNHQDGPASRRPFNWINIGRGRTTTAATAPLFPPVYGLHFWVKEWLWMEDKCCQRLTAAVSSSSLCSLSSRWRTRRGQVSGFELNSTRLEKREKLVHGGEAYPSRGLEWFFYPAAGCLCGGGVAGPDCKRLFSDHNHLLLLYFELLWQFYWYTLWYFSVFLFKYESNVVKHF